MGIASADGLNSRFLQLKQKLASSGFLDPHLVQNIFVFPLLSDHAPDKS